MNIKHFFYFLLIVVLISACQSNSEKQNKDDWNTGAITIPTDENLKDIAEQLVEVYQHDYEQATIKLNFQPQDKIINDFINGKITSMIINRNLTKNELETGTQHQGTKVIENILAYNAIALIANKNFKDSTIQISDIKGYLQPNSSVKLVFDNKQSGIPKFIMQQENLDVALFKNALVVNNTNEVIEYINRNTAAIGFITFNYISDADAKSTQEILSKVKVLAISNNNTSVNISQQSIYDGTYNLMQPISIVLGKNPETVGTAFVNWTVKERAAKILLKAGLVPRVMPNRNMNIVDELKTN
jgi:phosphate transport system substrate-binding protein